MNFTEPMAERIFATLDEAREAARKIRASGGATNVRTARSLPLYRHGSSPGWSVFFRPRSLGAWTHELATIGGARRRDLEPAHRKLGAWDFIEAHNIEDAIARAIKNEGGADA